MVLLVATVVGLVMPPEVICTVRPAGMLWFVSSAHCIVSPVGLEQKPTSWPVVVSVTVSPPLRPAKVVPVGKVMSMRLLALLASAPLAERVNAMTYLVRAPAAVVGLVLSTVIALS